MFCCQSPAYLNILYSSFIIYLKAFVVYQGILLFREKISGVNFFCNKIIIKQIRFKHMSNKYSDCQIQLKRLKQS